MGPIPQMLCYCIGPSASERLAQALSPHPVSMTFVFSPTLPEPSLIAFSVLHPNLF